MGNDLREYECVMVLHPGTSATHTEAIHSRFETSVATHGGEVRLKDDWGMREMAYEIEKQHSGHYWFFKFTANNTMVAEADRDMRLDDKVIRHLIVRDEKWEERNRASQARRAARRGEDNGS